MNINRKDNNFFGSYFDTDGIKIVAFKGYEYGFSVCNRIFSAEEIVNTHSYLINEKRLLFHIVAIYY